MSGAATIPKFTDLERRLLRPRVVYALADWAERFRYVTAGPLIPPSGAAVKWSNETFPLQLAIMEALEDPTWSHVVVMAPPQAGGKTDTAAVNLILKSLHHDHRTCAYIGANDTKSDDFWHRKLLPAMIAPSADASLRDLIPRDRESGGTRDRRDFSNKTALHLVGANSSADLSSFTASVIVCDDVQSMPKSLPGFAHPMDIAFKRTGSFAEEDTIKVALGTAGIVGDRLDVELKASTEFRPHVPCQKCGTYQLISWDRMVFDKTDAVAAYDDCWMRCENEACDHKIRDDELPVMLRGFRWAARGQTVKKKGQVCGDLPKTRIAGFWWNALYWPFSGWGQFAAEWVAAQGNPEKMKDFQQSVLAIPFKEPEIDEQRLTVDELKTHMIPEGYAAGTVPEWADLVTAQADVQSGYVFFTVHAWRKADGENALVTLGTRGQGLRGRQFESKEAREAARMSGIMKGLTEVDALIAEGFPVVNAKGEVVGHIHVKRAVVDRGYEPATVASWFARFHRGVWTMIKGQKAGAHSTLWPTTKKDGLKFDGKNRPYRIIAVNEAKSIVRRLLRITQGEPGYWHMPASGIHPKTLRTYFSHLAAEHYNHTKSPPRWEPRLPDARHDYWDCVIYGLAVALGLGVRVPFITTPAAEKKPRPRARKKTVNRFETPSGRPFVATRGER